MYAEKVTLSPRQHEVVQLVWAGMKNREIAAKLKLSVKTVEAHRQLINAKYGTKNAAQLLKVLLRDGVISQRRGAC